MKSATGVSVSRSTILMACLPIHLISYHPIPCSRESKEANEALSASNGECEQVKMAAEAMERENRNIKKSLLALTGEHCSLSSIRAPLRRVERNMEENLETERRRCSCA